jgi:hypothetical protein
VPSKCHACETGQKKSHEDGQECESESERKVRCNEDSMLSGGEDMAVMDRHGEYTGNVA